jgi:hypothetical protein
MKEGTRLLAVIRLLITSKRGSAKHSVNDDHAFLWKEAIFSHLSSQNPSTDQVKFCTTDNVGEFPRCAKNGCNRLAGGHR